MDRTDWADIIAAMRAGGYYDAIMAAGPELDRVKEYLMMFAGERDPKCAYPMMDPLYPCFPGLRHLPFHDPQRYEAARILEQSYETIREEALQLETEESLDYTLGSLPDHTLRNPLSFLQRKPHPRSWTVYPFFHMGVFVEHVTASCPKTAAIVANLPDSCAEYPWADVIFSVQGPHSRLVPHCSIDNLRVRCHLGIAIPKGTGIRVEKQKQTWAEGQCLVFEDSFEHEVWNHSDQRRIVLIADLWHPDLTAVERRALSAGFRKAEVRRVFLSHRLKVTNGEDKYLPVLDAALRVQDRAAPIREFWPR